MFHLGWFLTTGFGVYGWQDRWSGNVASDLGRPDLFIDTVRSLERAGFDYVMLLAAPILGEGGEGGGSATSFREMRLQIHRLGLRRAGPRRNL